MANTKDIFSSARLLYRAVRQPQDLPVFQAINNDPVGYVNSNASNIRLASPADAADFMKSTAEDNLLGAVIWIRPSEVEKHDKYWNGHHIRDADFGIAIGEIHLGSLPAKHAHHRWTEIGIDILPAYQGSGFGSEAIDWALEYAFKQAGMHRVRIRVFEWNEGAVKLYEKLGFTHEGRERESLWWDGKWWDGITMGMLEGEWREREEKKQKIVVGQ
jgi:RimJ/RimL family protein N-acetyltransferase